MARMPVAQVHQIGGRRGWVIWLVALSVYVLAVLTIITTFQRIWHVRGVMLADEAADTADAAL